VRIIDPASKTEIAIYRPPRNTVGKTPSYLRRHRKLTMFEYD
jgi:hypothetical protein